MPLLNLRAPAFGAALAGLALLAAPARAEEISVTQYGTSMYGAPFAVAMERGLFGKAGIDVSGINGSGGGGTTVRNILASPLPYGEVATAAAIAAAAQGLDVVIVNVGTRTVAESTLVTMPNSELKSAKELAGKKVAITSPRGSSDMLLQLVLRAEGVEIPSVQRIAAGGYVNALTMLEQGAVAAATLIEPLSIIRADKYRTIAAARTILPPMTTSVGITTRAYAKANPDKIRAIIAGRKAGVEALYADPAAAAAIIARIYKLDAPVAKAAVDNMIGPRMWSLGEFSQAELDRLADGLRLIGELKGDLDWSKLIDKSYLPAELQAKS